MRSDPFTEPSTRSVSARRRGATGFGVDGEQRRSRHQHRRGEQDDHGRNADREEPPHLVSDAFLAAITAMPMVKRYWGTKADSGHLAPGPPRTAD